MTIQLPPDVEQLVAFEMQRGKYASPGDVLRDALQALAERNDDIAAIAEGIADMEAGRVTPAREAEAMLRRSLDFLARRGRNQRELGIMRARCAHVTT